MQEFEKIVIITRKTALEELVERFNTREQARFYIEHMGGSFDDYQLAHDTYKRAQDALREAIPTGVRFQFIERSFLPMFTFGAHDLIVTLGPDGLVVNTAKYLDTQPLVAFNPDPQRIDGVLVPFRMELSALILRQSLCGTMTLKKVAMAKAQLNDGQSLYAVNDLFIGQASHVSARYSISYAGRIEAQSSSGIIVSTGAGSTGWLRSVVTGAAQVMASLHPETKTQAAVEDYRFAWEAEQLVFSVREPFVSKVSGAQLVFGKVEARQPLTITSHMPQNGVIFSDGVENDYMEFNSGAIAQVSVAEKKLYLVVHS